MSNGLKDFFKDMINSYQFRIGVVVILGATLSQAFYIVFYNLVALIQGGS